MPSRVISQQTATEQQLNLKTELKQKNKKRQRAHISPYNASEAESWAPSP